MPRLSPKSLAVLLAVVGLVVLAAALYLRPTAPGEAAGRQVEKSASAAVAVATPPEPEEPPAAELPAMVSALLAPETAPATRAYATDLLTGDDDKRAEAIGELGFLDDRRWLPVVLWVLARDGQATVRSAAAAALATASSSPAAAHGLTAALLDPDAGVREDALLSLKAIRNDVVEKDLRQLLAAHRLDPDTTREVRLFLDRYYAHLDPFADPLAE